jgi:hypothetical protein
MAGFLAGNKLTADRLSIATAKYARRSGDGTLALNNGSGTLLTFPTSVTTNANVVASGTGNSAFTVQAGLWHVVLSLRTNVLGYMDIYCMSGTSYNESNALIVGGANSFNANLSSEVEITSATALCFGVFQSSASRSVASFGVDACHIRLSRLVGYY